MLKKLISVFTVCIVLLGAVSVSTAVFAEDYATFNLVIKNYTSGKVTVTVSLPDGIGSGKILLDSSADLTYVSGSFSSPILATYNENYDGADGTGLNVAFASSEQYDKDTVAFTAEFTAAEGAQITVDDIVVRLWNLSDGERRISDQTNGDVNKSLVNLCTVSFEAGNGGSLEGVTSLDVEVGTVFSALSYPTTVAAVNYRFKSWSLTEGTVVGDTTLTANFYLIGDVNYSGKTDNLDAARILKKDANLIEFDAEMLLIGDVNNDGKVNSLDAAAVLKFDAGIIDKF